MILMPTEEDLDKLNYFELLVEKNRIVDYINHFENDVKRKNRGWGAKPAPSTIYQLYLDYLGILAPKLSEAFRKEYEFSDKNITNYYMDMKKNKKEKFKNVQPDIHEW